MIRNLLLRTYSRLLFLKWDIDAHAAERRMRGCKHERTIFVDVGSPPYDCVEKCWDCWALKLPKLGQEWPTDETVWFPNSTPPKKSVRVERPTDQG